MDKVTISFYSMETIEDPGYTQKFLAQIANIKKIRDGLVKAAEKAGREPPEFIISIILIPDWKRSGNSYQDETYLAKKNLFLQEFINSVKHIENTVVEDFLTHGSLSPEEQAYMHQLMARGGNADMIKTRAIINNLTRYQHLQLDSNTIVPNFDELYSKTFGATIQKDGINASFYDEYYITAHNKMIYTTPTGLMATNGHLEKRLREWCKDHQDDNDDKQKNSIYAKVFTRALHDIDYVKEFMIEENEKNKSIYPATLDEKVYWLTTCMTTAVNMSWKSSDIRMNQDLLDFPPVLMDKDGLFDYPCLLNVIKKHTNDLTVHSTALKLHD